MDFIVKLLLLKESIIETKYDSLLVIIDKLTKYIYFIPYKEANNAEEIAYAFLKIVVAQHSVLT